MSATYRFAAGWLAVALGWGCQAPSPTCPTTQTLAASPSASNLPILPKRFRPELVPGYATTLCDPMGAEHVLLSELRLADPAIDYVDLRIGRVSRAHAGFRCDAAPDRTRCAQTFAALEVPPGEAWAPPALKSNGGPASLVVGRAGTFTRLSKQADILVALGPIDSLAEAALLAILRGYEPWCEPASSWSGQPDRRGWRLTVRDPGASAWGPRAVHNLYDMAVTEDGSFRVMSRTTLFDM